MKRNTLNVMMGLFVLLGLTGCGGGGNGSGSSATTKYVFLTSQDVNGGRGGLAGADALCTQNATAGGLGGTWKAWLSDSTTNVLARINDVGGWTMVGTSTVAINNKTTLVVGPSNLSWRDQNGSPVNGTPNIIIWTGTNADGATGTNCANWTSAGVAVGDTGLAVTTPGWNFFPQGCSNAMKLLCLQQ